MTTAGARSLSHQHRHCAVTRDHQQRPVAEDLSKAEPKLLRLGRVGCALHLGAYSAENDRVDRVDDREDQHGDQTRAENS
jgi:hypothetical protein